MRTSITVLLAARAVLLIPTGVCSIFMSPKNGMAAMHGIFNVRTHVNASYCTLGLHGHRKRVLQCSTRDRPLCYYGYGCQRVCIWVAMQFEKATVLSLWVCLSKSAGLVIERLRVRIPAGKAGKFSSPELTLCADFYSSYVPPPCYHSGTWKTPVILPKVQVAGYT